MNPHWRVSPHRAVLLSSLWVTVAFALIAGAGDQPFTEHSIDTDLGTAKTVDVADFDGDGHLDILAVASNNDPNVLWRHNSNGDGSSWVEYPVGLSLAGAAAAVAADITGNGYPDIVATIAGAHDDLVYWVNDGTPLVGSWTKRWVDAGALAAYAIDAADLDGDGDIDILMTTLDDSSTPADDGMVWWYENADGAGTAWIDHTFFPVALDTPRSVHAADIDGDGDLDLMTAVDGMDSIYWLENDGTDPDDGIPWPLHVVTSTFERAASARTGDLDGDGDLDIVGAALDDGVLWWRNDDTVGDVWTEMALDGGFGYPYLARSLDLDLDGDLDVLATAYQDDDVTWWENGAGDGSVWFEHTIDPSFNGAYWTHAADLDGDGDLDVVATAAVGNDISWWENQTIHRSGTFPIQQVVDGDLDGAKAVAAADLDGDGDLDVVGAGEGGEVAWWENAVGDGSVFTSHAIDGDYLLAFAVVVVDVDSDGDADVVGAGNQDAPVLLWRNADGAGGAWSEETVFDQNALDLAAADVDGDGDADLVAAMTYPYVIENGGGGLSWIPRFVTTAFSGTITVDVGDVDGDGDLDLVAGTNLGDDISWFENDGAMPTSADPWFEHPVVVDSFTPGSVQAADLDRDGDLDIVGSDDADNEVVWFSNDLGDGSAWTAAVIDDGSLSDAGPVAVADLDRDGDLDVAVGVGSIADLVWFENTSGDASTWIEHRFGADVSTGHAIEIADIDGNGTPDVISAHRGADDIGIFRNRGGQFALATTDTAPPTFYSGQLDDVLSIDLTHRGRSGDAVAQLETIELLFEESAGDPLTTARANALIEDMWIFMDEDEDGVLDYMIDTHVCRVDTLDLIAGVQSFVLADDERSQVEYASTKRFFVAPRFTDDAYQQSPGQLQITHLTSASSTAIDADHDIPLELEYAGDVSSSIVVPADPTIFSDGFELGNTSRWSPTAPAPRPQTHPFRGCRPALRPCERSIPAG